MINVKVSVKQNNQLKTIGGQGKQLPDPPPQKGHT